MYKIVCEEYFGVNSKNIPTLRLYEENEDLHSSLINYIELPLSFNGLVSYLLGSIPLNVTNIQSSELTKEIFSSRNNEMMNLILFTNEVCINLISSLLIILFLKYAHQYHIIIRKSNSSNWSNQAKKFKNISKSKNSPTLPLFIITNYPKKGIFWIK